VSGPDRLTRLAAMLRARRFDETLIANAELVSGVFHVSIGHEAVAAALAGARTASDLIMLNHRNHGALAAIGTDVEVSYREILGRDGGPQRGRAGSLHLADVANGVPYTSAMVAGGVALAVGMALAKQRLGRAGIVFAFFGDGAMGEGAMYESLNLAALWKLPLLFVCESNASADRDGGGANALQAARTLTALADVHQIPATAVDGGDPQAVAATMDDAVAAVRAGGGPRFIEARLHPWPGNATFLPRLVTGELDLSDAERTGDAGAWSAADPVLAEARALLRDGVALADLLVLDRSVRATVQRAFASAAAAPSAPDSVATSAVWAAP
jgi:TPP-dependent pyruvate/acetoin dehydrogenase alpha subunit